MRLDSNGSSQKITMHFLASLILTAATPGSSFVIAAISSAMRYSFSNEYCGWTSSVTASPEKADIPLSAETMTVPDRRIENMLRKFVKFRFSYIIDCQITRCFEDPCAEVLNIRRRSAIQLYKQLLHDVLASLSAVMRQITVKTRLFHIMIQCGKDVLIAASNLSKAFLKLPVVHANPPFACNDNCAAHFIGKTAKQKLMKCSGRWLEQRKSRPLKRTARVFMIRE